MNKAPDLFAGMEGPMGERGEYLRSPLNYMGSKIDSLDQIYPHLPFSEIFVDACSGSGQVLLGKPKVKLEVLNDRNAGIAAFYRCLQTPETMDKLIQTIELMPHSRELFMDGLENWMKEQDQVIRAAKWYYLIQCSFGGKGQYFGRVTKGYSNIWDKIHGNVALFAGVHERLKGVLIENADWRQLIKDFDGHDTVFYFDPPYFDANVYYHNFRKQDHLDMCAAIHQCDGFVALSGYENEIYNAYAWDERIKINVKELKVQKAYNHFDDVSMKDKRQEYLYIKDWS